MQGCSRRDGIALGRAANDQERGYSPLRAELPRPTCGRTHEALWILHLRRTTILAGSSLSAFGSFRPVADVRTGGISSSNDRAYGAAEFLSVQEYRNIDRWVETISAREAVQRGRIVNLTRGPEEHRVTERHEAADIDKVRTLMMAEGAEEPAV